MVMPGDAPRGGFADDGCVMAGDTGGAIIGEHVDFFAALRAASVSLDDQPRLAQVTVRDGGSRCPVDVTARWSAAHAPV